MLAWVHFLTCELRPLYFLVFSGASLTQSVENRVRLWGPDNTECFLNKRFYRCASSCSTVWEPKSCACERGAWHWCTIESRLTRNRTDDLLYVPEFILEDGLDFYTTAGAFTEAPGWDGTRDVYRIEGRAEAYKHVLVTNSHAYPSISMDPADVDIWYGFVFNMAVIVAPSCCIFLYANYCFLRDVGWSADLEGRYVRFCLRLVVEARYRWWVRGYTTVLTMSMLAMVVMMSIYSSPSSSVLVELAFIFVSCRSLIPLVDEKYSIVDLDDEGFDHVRFAFTPLFKFGCDEVMQDLAAAQVRRAMGPRVYKSKADGYVISGAANIKLAKPTPQVEAALSDILRDKVSDESGSGTKRTWRNWGRAFVSNSCVFLVVFLTIFLLTT